MGEMVARHRQCHQSGATRGDDLARHARHHGIWSQGMATAWAEGNRVVLSKASNPEYGVELAGNAAAGRLQFRCLVSAIPPRSEIGHGTSTGICLVF